MAGNLVLDSLVFDPERGSTSFRDIRYFLLRPETIAEIYRQVDERCGEAVREIFFRGAYHGVSLSIQAGARRGSRTQGEEFLAYMTQAAGMLGWGKVSVVASGPGELVLEVVNSVWAHGQSGWNHPICDPLRGCFAATAEALWQRPVTAREETCQAMGHDHCRFVISPRQE